MGDLLDPVDGELHGMFDDIPSSRGGGASVGVEFPGRVFEDVWREVDCVSPRRIWIVANQKVDPAIG